MIDSKKTPPRCGNTGMEAEFYSADGAVLSDSKCSLPQETSVVNGTVTYLERAGVVLSQVNQSSRQLADHILLQENGSDCGGGLQMKYYSVWVCDGKDLSDLVDDFNPVLSFDKLSLEDVMELCRLSFLQGYICVIQVTNEGGD